ncbi:uncharacterized protein FIBRA_04960 [Fibroporia radiculosa]|uniref:Uncharacterized protein n=1 Tax=Fibroporia radiculosa TaxID=599839 RepID=J4G886_9APHY|nr:uncharacterized protein FIBRA_04960 [Fibroporia radiculosa]CCM02848.1 predicted protein [Fibroporia radiculosa]
MVKLLLSPAKGNASSPYFPFHGYLGLTPVKVEGTVRTRIEEDGKSILAKSISVSVRCYESRSSRTRGTGRTSLLVDYTDVLWSKPETSDWADVGDLDLSFKITLPKRTAGLSTANFQVYRTFWRVEASEYTSLSPSIISLTAHHSSFLSALLPHILFIPQALEHTPIIGIGRRTVRHFDLALVRYDLPPYPLLPSSPPPPISSQHPSYLQTNKPRAPVLRYSISAPNHPVGPNDIVFASLSLQPLDHNVYVRHATLVVERRIDILSPSASASATSTPSASPYLPSHDSVTPKSSNSHLSVSAYTSGSASPMPLTPTSSTTSFESHASSRPLLSESPQAVSSFPPSSFPYPLRHSSSGSSEPPEKTLVLPVLTTECSGFARDAAGVWSKTLSMQWPTARPQSRWALGETMHSELASVRFFIRVTVRVTGPAGTDILELEPHEIVIVATSEAERRTALTKYAEQREGALRSKSKSPWRARHSDDEQDVARRAAADGQSKSYPDIHDDAARSAHHRKGGQSQSGMAEKEKTRVKTARRPHTSAGPRDKSSFPYTGDIDLALDTNAGAHETLHARRESRGHARRTSGQTGGPTGVEGADVASEHDNGRKPSENGRRLEISPKDRVRVWEEESTRIETQSRRSPSHILGSLGLNFGRKKQVSQRG